MPGKIFIKQLLFLRHSRLLCVSFKGNSALREACLRLSKIKLLAISRGYAVKSIPIDLRSIDIGPRVTVLSGKAQRGYCKSSSTNLTIFEEFVFGMKCESDLCSSSPDSSQTSDLPIFEAYELWKCGHILDAYDKFADSYCQGDLKTHTLSVLQSLAYSTVRNKGKAQRQLVVDGAVLFTQRVNETTVILTVWYALFSSEWHEDQLLSNFILRVSANLRSSLETYLPLFGRIFLQNDELNHYQRAIEVALQFRIGESPRPLLRALFYYYYKNGYVTGCQAVLKCCEELGIKSSADQFFKLNCLSNSTFPKVEMKKNILIPKDIKYKF